MGIVISKHIGTTEDTLFQSDRDVAIAINMINETSGSDNTLTFKVYEGSTLKETIEIKLPANYINFPKSVVAIVPANRSVSAVATSDGVNISLDIIELEVEQNGI